MIGIDLGTTNSLCAVFRNNRTELVPNRYGSVLTPSVVSILDDGTTIVGQEARERLVTAPERTAASFKRDMGTDRVYELGREKMKPEELSALVLRSLVKDAEDYLGEPVTEAIISVPAYFHDKQRTATKMAGKLAGLNVKRIINEPSAAALAAYMETDEEKLYLVFDFGGGTLDVSVVSCFDTVVQIESIAGDNRLGGNDFDAAIAEDFLHEHGLKKRALSSAEYAVVLKRAEACKKTLTEKDFAFLVAPVNGENLKSSFTNQRLMHASGDIFARIKKLIGQVLKDRRLTTADIDAVVLAGGSSRMPIVRSYLRHLFGRKMKIAGDADEMIAMGLGAICGIIGREGDLKDYVMTDISSFSLGTSIRNPSDSGRNYMSVLIPRNTSLPASRKQTYCTSVDNQKHVRVDVYQGEHPYAADNLFLGDLLIDVRPAPAGQEKVDVRFTYDLDGILIVDVTVCSTGVKFSRVFSQEADEEAVKKKLVYLEHFKLEEKDRAENRLLMEQLHALFEASGAEDKPAVMNCISGYEAVLKKGSEREIRKYRKYVQDFLDRAGDYDPFVEAMPVLVYKESDYDDEEDEYSDLWDD